MINFESFNQQCSQSDVAEFTEQLSSLSKEILSQPHGDMPNWIHSINQLPKLNTDEIFLNQDTVTATGIFSPEQKEKIIKELKTLMPWRKGPFQLFDIFIDTEWRSDWKWQRVLPHISPLKNKTVLDVGCGSGYHCYRMLGEGADFVIGIDPSLKFLAQFVALQRYMNQPRIHLLPLKSEQLPINMQCFDTVFSMGVLYHRKSPLEHIEELKNALKSGGELVLETLVIKGDRNTCLMPNDRYAQMRNVWYLPSVEMLKIWLERLGFENIIVADINQTSTDEQRSTEWMQFHSLKEYLDPNDSNKTIEGYPAPLRATLIATKP